jgi:hypothetical protein
MNPFDSLIDRTRHGDRAAADALWRKLRPHLPRVVRHALAQPHATTPLTRLVREAARHVLAEPDGRRLNRHQFVDRIAERSYDMLMRDGIRAQTWCPDGHETVML